MADVSNHAGEVLQFKHPFRNRMAYADNFDEMFDLLQEVKEEQRKLRSVELAIRSHLGAVSVGDKLTRRIYTESGRTVKVLMPGDHWKQSVLRRVWDIAGFKRYLRITAWAPNLREIAKLEGMAGPSLFMERRQLLLSAREPSTAAPTVTLEDA